MNWKVVETNDTKTRVQQPYASVGFGYFCLNAAACRLVPELQSYAYAQFLTVPESGAVGLRFLKEAEENSVALRLHDMEGDSACGAELVSLNAQKQLFPGQLLDTVRFSVSVDPDDASVLVLCEGRPVKKKAQNEEETTEEDA